MFLVTHFMKFGIEDLKWLPISKCDIAYSFVWADKDVTLSVYEPYIGLI